MVVRVRMRPRRLAAMCAIALFLGGALASSSAARAAGSGSIRLQAFTVPLADYEITAGGDNALAPTPDGSGEVFAVGFSGGYTHNQLLKVTPSGSISQLPGNVGTSPLVGMVRADGYDWAAAGQPDPGLYAIDSAGTATLVSTSTGDLRDMTLGPNGDLYVADHDGNVVQYAVAGGATPSARLVNSFSYMATSIDPGGENPDAIGSAGGKIWLTDDGAVLSSMTIGGMFAGPYGSIGTPSSGVVGGLSLTLTTGLDGNLYSVGGGFVDPGGELLRINPSNPSAIPVSFGVAAGLPAGADIASITTGADGNVWFTDPGRQAIGELDVSSGKITERHVPGSYALPTGVSAAIEPGPDNTLWFPLLGPLAPYGQGGEASQAAIGEISGLVAPAKTLPGVVGIAARAKVSGTGVAAVSLSCHGRSSATCSGALTLSHVLKVRVKHKGRIITVTKTVRLGSVSYSLAAGQTKLLRVKLSSAAVRAVNSAKKRQLTATATAAPSSGRRVTKSVTLIGARR